MGPDLTISARALERGLSGAAAVPAYMTNSISDVDKY
jgi:hypothetical protein